MRIPWSPNFVAYLAGTSGGSVSIRVFVIVCVLIPSTLLLVERDRGARIRDRQWGSRRPQYAANLF